MGLFNFGKKSRQSEVQSNNTQQESIWDIQYNSISTNSTVSVKFDDLVELEGKTLQRVHIDYFTEQDAGNARPLNGTEYLVEPSISTDDNGTQVNTTKEYYQELLKTNPSLCKGFFYQPQVTSQKTNYIGAIEVGKNGEYTSNRYMDRDFEQRYSELIERQKRDADSRLRSELSRSTYQPKEISPDNMYQQMCNNEDERASGMKNLSGKTDGR